MAKTTVSDVIIPSVFAPYFINRTAEKSALFRSGIIGTDAELDRIASGEGNTFNLPFWDDLSGASEGLSDSSALTVGNITADKDVAVKHFRGRAWSANDLAKYLAGSNPMEAIGDLVATYWARRMQKDILIPTLKGVFATALASSHTHDVAIEDGDNAAAANLIGDDQVIEAITGLLGDAWEEIEGLVMHSVPFKRLQKLDLIEFAPISEQDIMIPRFLGREVIVDDGVPTQAGGNSGTKYTTYLFGRGSVGFGDGGPVASEAAETDRDVLAGDDILVTRRHFILHPRGLAFTGTPSGQTPTTGELETGGNWTKKYEDKQIRITQLITNG